MTFSDRTANWFICPTMWTCPCHGENCQHIQWHNSQLVYLSYIVELSLWQRKKLPTQSMAVQGTGFSVLHCADTPAPVRGSVHIRLKWSTSSNLAQRNQQEKIDETASFALVPFWSCFRWLQPCSSSLLHTATQYIYLRDMFTPFSLWSLPWKLIRSLEFYYFLPQTVQDFGTAFLCIFTFRLATAV